MIAPIITSYIILVYISESELINIRSVSDLAGKTIGTVEGSVAVDYLRNEGFSMKIILYKNIDDMFFELKIMNFITVYDFLFKIISIYKNFIKYGTSNLTLSGPTLYKQKYVMPVNNIEAEEEINKCLIKIVNTPYYSTNYNKWLEQ